MKSYEVEIEKKQPPCGGKPPIVYDFIEVTIEDPVEFVKEREPSSNLEISEVDGDVVVEINEGAHQMKYTFTEI